MERCGRHDAPLLADFPTVGKLVGAEQRDEAVDQHLFCLCKLSLSFVDIFGLRPVLLLLCSISVSAAGTGWKRFLEVKSGVAGSGSVLVGSSPGPLIYCTVFCPVLQSSVPLCVKVYKYIFVM